MPRIKVVACDGRRGRWCEVLSVQMPVLAATDPLLSELKALSQHQYDSARPLPGNRTLRGQIRWHWVRGAADDYRFASAVLFPLERLGIITPD